MNQDKIELRELLERVMKWCENTDARVEIVVNFGDEPKTTSYMKLEWVELDMERI
jgi:hypothetical protein